MRAFVDTAVFILAAGKPHPLRASAREVLKSLRDGDVVGVIDAEVIQELLHVLVRRGARDKALRMARIAWRLSDEVLPVTATDMRLACEILARHAVPVRDAVHAATMLAAGVERIISPDSDFDGLPGVTRQPLVPDRRVR